MKKIFEIKSRLNFDFLGVPLVYVVRHETFLFYLKNGRLSSNDQKQITKIARKMIAKGSTHMVSVRRAYYHPQKPDLPGPRFNAMKSPQDILNAIIEIFKFAIEQNYYSQKKVLIEVFFYPFIDPPKVKFPITERTELPRGGAAFAVNNDGSVVKVLAVYGFNEGVQSLSSVDEFIVDTKELVIMEKLIRQKTEGLITTSKEQYDILSLPLFLQFRQVINDLEVLELAKFVAVASSQREKPQRIEYSYGDGVLYVNELIDYEITENFTIGISKKGKVKGIASEQDLKKISPSPDKKEEANLKAVVNELLNKLAAEKSELTILYPGSSATAHPMRVLIDKGHNAFLVGTREFTTGEYVEITSKENKVEIKKVALVEKNILPLELANLFSVEVIGGKAQKLSQLINLGYQVPEGYVIKAGVNHRSFLTSLEFRQFLNKLDKSVTYSVRSSANVEDSYLNAFAGQFESFLHVKPGAIAEHVKKVWQSARAKHLDVLLRDLKAPSVKMAVVIQKMVKPQFSGVIFGANSETKNTNQVVIELVADYADKLVSGLASGRRIVFDKFTKTIVFDNKKVQAPESTIKSLFEMYLKLEENFNNIQDVEWTISSDNELFLLQTRDLLV